jgi:hypothetical protein
MNASRRLRWALHAFPRRFRAQRCAEIESTFQEADLAGDPKAYGTAALIDVVVAGWRERARTRPPLGPYLKYRLLAGRLDQRWHSWMFDDLGGWFPARRAAWTVSLLALIWVAVWRISDGSFALPESFFWLVWVIAASVTAGLERRRTLKRHGYDPRTRTWVPPVVVNWVPAPRRIRRAAPMLTGVAVALLVVAPFAAVTLLFPERSLHSITIGSFSFVRIVDHAVAAGWAAVALGCIVLAAGLAKRHWIATRVLVTADTVSPTKFVVVPGGTPAWVTPMVVVIAGIATSTLPIAPMVVTAAFLAAGCASPVLLVLAHSAREHEHHTSAAVGLSTAPHAAHQRATPR